MMAARVGLALAGAVMIALAGCGNRDKAPILMHAHSDTNGPDEFSILPPKPLEMPEDLTALPDPTPGGHNLTDPTPKEDAIAALGGTAPAAAGGIPSGDGALVAQATRHGVQSDIRANLAAEDLEFRRKHDGRLLEKLFNVNVYYKAYRKMSLDQHAELLRWRARGAKTPSAPPPQKGETK